MRNVIAVATALLVVVLGFGLPAMAADPAYKVLVFSKTAGFRHDAIPAGITALRGLATENGFTVDTTEDAGAFTTANLAGYRAVVFLMTTGDVLNATQQTAFESYIAGGGGYVGVHAAADTEYDWPFYGGLVGAYFASHPAIQQATVRVEDTAHPSTAHLPRAWVRTDELYNYRTNPRSTAHVLATLDESTYSGGSMGADHPIAWCKPYQGGRAWYTGLGHTADSYTEPNFRAHLYGGVRYAAGVAPADCGSTPTPTPTPTPGVVLLSAGRPVSVSSTENAGFAGSNAVDGNAGTRWSSAFSDPQWISVDLGSAKQVSRVRLQWETAYGRAYRVETSADGVTWSSAYSTTASDGGVDDITFPAVSARHVRVYGTQRATAWGYSLWETEVYGR
ncbi:ThuA domain-containing protein [Streptosporangium sp. NBC_01639]|uniref:ThuA domain-containing protein n=1 Tax=unclassified Streptosporangium TaxID=2632669 RepID=UPI002DDC8C02|nr:ThuA domain-containing protein [Streptosporangium sp. NBC_01756]WSC88702.1 ThuA domain-containing protein [Streptosporangium sp. NBC_01756]WTD52612.1 ThuA domain-containing protein [Streptosporangium sp. NBC_01639]